MITQFRLLRALYLLKTSHLLLGVREGRSPVHGRRREGGARTVEAAAFEACSAGAGLRRSERVAGLSGAGRRLLLAGRGLEGRREGAGRVAKVDAEVGEGVVAALGRRCKSSEHKE